MTEKDNQAAPVEEKKPAKKSFVSEKDAPPIGAPAPENKIVPCEVSLMLIYNQAKITNELLTEMRDLMKGVAPSTPKTSAPAPTSQAQVPIPVTQPAPASTLPMTPTLQKLIDGMAKAELDDLVYIDEAANDTLFYIVRPRQFLGSENFAKVASFMRGIGGQYQSAGRNSHFKVSKAGQ